MPRTNPFHLGIRGHLTVGDIVCRRFANYKDKKGYSTKPHGAHRGSHSEEQDRDILY